MRSAAAWWLVLHIVEVGTNRFSSVRSQHASEAVAAMTVSGNFPLGSRKRNGSVLQGVAEAGESMLEASEQTSGEMIILAGMHRRVEESSESAIGAAAGGGLGLNWIWIIIVVLVGFAVIVGSCFLLYRRISHSEW